MSLRLMTNAESDSSDYREHPPHSGAGAHWPRIHLVEDRLPEAGVRGLGPRGSDASHGHTGRLSPWLLWAASGVGPALRIPTCQTAGAPRASVRLLRASSSPQSCCVRGLALWAWDGAGERSFMISESYETGTRRETNDPWPSGCNLGNGRQPRRPIHYRTPRCQKHPSEGRPHPAPN